MNHHQAARLQQIMGLMVQAIARQGVGQTQEALALLDQALVLDPGFIPAHMQRGTFLEQAARLPEALAAYEQCLLVAPAFHDARQARERVLHALVAQCEAGLAAGAEETALHVTLADAWRRLGQLTPALAQARLAVASAPNHFPARALMADLLLRLNRHEEALQCYDALGEARADSETALLYAFNRADILRQMGRFDEALALLEPVVQQRPAFAEAQVARAHLLLMRGDFLAGWRAHEMRHGIAQLAGRCPRPELPPWREGQSIAGKHVLLWAEQGLGDSLQFARYLAPLATRAASVTVCVPAGLVALLASAFPACQVVADARELGPLDLQAPLMSLPLLLEMPAAVGAPATPYLHADAACAAGWQARLDEAAQPRRLRIGLAWAGRQYAQINHSRDIPLAQLLPLLALPIDFIALQPELPEADEATMATLAGSPGRLLRFALGDWADTAALVSPLDLVITVDTAVAHLAGAMGKPTWVMTRFEGEWRWGLHPSETAWYPAMRLFRQQRRGHWDEVVAQLVQACTALPSMMTQARV